MSGTVARLEAVGARARADLAAARRAYEGRRDRSRGELTRAAEAVEAEALPRLMAPVSFGAASCAAARLRTAPRSRGDSAIG
ncbi:hypothetical protein [Gordonia iterans]